LLENVIEVIAVCFTEGSSLLGRIIGIVVRGRELGGFSGRGRNGRRFPCSTAIGGHEEQYEESALQRS
jgi:hypothetical protein